MSMNTIRTKVKQAIVGREEKQKDIAEALGIPPQYLSEMLNTDKGGLSKRWQELLDYLGFELELSVKPKSPTLDDESRAWLDSDLSRLSEFPYDWGEVDPDSVGEPLRYDSERGWVSDES